jgi:hypothetical protein
MISITLATAEGVRSIGSAADPLDGADVTTLVAATGGGFWALVEHRQVFRIVRGRAEAVARLDRGVVGWCLLEHAGTLFMGTEAAGLYQLHGGALARVAGFDKTPGRSDWWQPPGRRPATTWTLASDSEHLFVNVHVGGVLRSNDRGESFTPTIDLNEDVHEVSVGPDRQLWAATGQKGLAVSTDAGVSWNHHDAGLHARYLSCVAPTDKGALVVASSDFAAGDDTLYRLDGAAFERCTVGIPAPLGGMLHARQLTANGRTAAVATPDGKLYLSKDAGRSWTLATEELPQVRAVVIAC